MTTHVQNQNAINQNTATNFAIFINPRTGQRYAINRPGVHTHTYKEYKGKWEHYESLETWCVHHADFQGFDDITTLIH